VKLFLHHPIGSHRPKRGDILRTNVGSLRERTCLVLATRPMRDRYCVHMQMQVHRTQLWVARWWELEPVARMLLYRSAERAGGQKVIEFQRFPANNSKRKIHKFM
jgi:hypothetical protein